MKFLYEKDLRQMKYTILTSMRHDETVRAIAARLGMSDAKLRMVLIRRFDMSLLENIESRWQMGQQHADDGDPVAAELGCDLFTRFIPLVDRETMQTIYSETTAMTQEMPFEEAVARGKERVREAVLS
ncbi:MAG: energy-converting hydrogenase subunit [Euryarchaeota archaeon]|nr:energy-converting hydrogenase subunit [Euryarchaeota archaeon]